MRQVQLERFGPPEVLKMVTRPTPRPPAGDVLVATRAVGVTFVETQIRAGRSPLGRRPELPAVLGNSAEGTVVDVGDGVDAGLSGELVAASTGGSGGYADHAVVAAKSLIRVPASLETGAAVALLADGRTALSLTQAAHLGGDDTVLVLAAAGGVGSLLVQLAGAAGARWVIGAVGSADKIDAAQRAGADVVVDYSAPGWTDQVAGSYRGVSVVFDGVGGRLGATAAELLEPGGRLVVFGSASGKPTNLAAARNRGVEVMAGWKVIRSPEHHRAVVDEAFNLAIDGRLRPTIGQRFPLDEAAAAHSAIETRQTIGKTILTP